MRNSLVRGPHFSTPPAFWLGVFPMLVACTLVSCKDAGGGDGSDEGGVDVAQDGAIPHDRDAAATSGTAGRQGHAGQSGNAGRGGEGGEAGEAGEGAMLRDAAVARDAGSDAGDGAMPSDAALAEDSGADAATSIADSGADAQLDAAPVPSYFVGGTVTGVTSGSITLRNNGGDDLVLAADGNFQFATPIADGGAYFVVVYGAPPGKSCQVSFHQGTVQGADVTDVVVACGASSYSVGGTITGLMGTLVIDYNGSGALNTSNNGAFTASAASVSGSPYEVTVGSKPSNQTCSVTNGMGTVQNANVTNILVSCEVDTFALGGDVSGLAKGESVVLQNSGGDDLSVDLSGPFTFKTELAAGTNYLVSVKQAPTGKICSVSHGAGTMSTQDVKNVDVTCSASSYTIGGTATGITGNVTLQNNGLDDLVVSANGAFTFATPMVFGASYKVSVRSSGISTACTLNAANGKVPNTNVTSVALDCAPATARFALVSGDAEIASYGIDATSLTLAPASTLAVSGVGQLVKSVNGIYAFGVNSAGDGVNVIRMNGQTGAMLAVDANGIAPGIQPFTAGNGPSSLAVHPNGKWLYVTNSIAGTISMFDIPATGKLVRIDTDPNVAGIQDYVVGAGPYALTMSPAGNYLYALLANDGGILAFSIDGITGLLTPLPGTPYSTSGKSAIAFSIGLSADRAYVTSFFNDGVYSYQIDNDGSLTLLNPVPFPTGSRPRERVIFVPGAGGFAYVSNTVSNDVSAFTVGAGGALVPIAGGPFPAQDDAKTMALHPSGRALYVLNDSAHTLTPFNISGTGTLTVQVTGSIAVPVFPAGMVVMP